MADLLHIIFRFLHIVSVIAFLGGVFYARQVLVPVLDSLPQDLRVQSARAGKLKFRNMLFVLLIVIVASGLFNFFTYSGPKHTQTYQILFGLKMLFVAHILSSAILWATSSSDDLSSATKDKRRLRGMVVSGVIVVFLSAWLRSLTQRGL